MAEEVQGDVFIVVCTQLHSAVGPYKTAEIALEAAEEMTEKDQCVYVPVPMSFRGTLKIIHHEEGGDDDRPVGQYL